MWGMLSFLSGALQSLSHRWMSFRSRLARPLLLEGETDNRAASLTGLTATFDLIVAILKSKARLQTLFSILQLSHDFLPLCRLCCCGNTKRAFTGKSGSVSIKGCRDPTLLLPFLFSLQTSSERTTHSVAEPLSLPHK